MGGRWVEEVLNVRGEVIVEGGDDGNEMPLRIAKVRCCRVL